MECEIRRPLGREEWITKFVNAIVLVYRPGLSRTIAVGAARDCWARLQGANPHRAAKEWANQSAGGADQSIGLRGPLRSDRTERDIDARAG